MLAGLGPDGALGAVIVGQGEGGQGLQVHLSVAVGCEQIGGDLAQAQPLAHQPLGHPEPRRDGGDGLPGADQGREGLELVGRVHRDAHGVFDQRGLERAVRRLDQARDRPVGGNQAVGRQRQQRPQPPSAGDHGVPALGVGGADDQVLLQAVGADARLQFGVIGRRGRRLAGIGRRQHQSVEGNLVKGSNGVHRVSPRRAGDSLSLAFLNPSPKPERASYSDPAPV